MVLKVRARSFWRSQAGTGLLLGNGRVAVAVEKDRRCGGKLLQRGEIAGNLQRGVPEYREALLRPANGGGQRVGQRDRAPAFQGQGEPRDSARYGDGAIAPDIGALDHGRPAEELFVAAGAAEGKHLRSRSRRGHHRVGDDLWRLIRRVDDHVSAAADTVHPGLDDASGEGGRHRGIDRVATPAQDIRARPPPARLGGDHPPASARFQPGDLPLRLHWHRSSLTPCRPTIAGRS